MASLLLWFMQDAWGVTTQRVDEDPQGSPYVAGELIVVYEFGLETAAAEDLPREVQGQVEEELPVVDAQVLSFPEVKNEASEAGRELALQQEKATLEADPAVESVSFNYFYTASYTPNDPRFDAQYGLKKIQAPRAWNRVAGNNADIAVVDTGISNAHPDLRAKIAGQRNFVGPTDTLSAEDDNGHGTFVSGVAAAVTNNGTGVAGACPECRIIAVKVFAANQDAETADVAEGITWAADNGAEVINLSLGAVGVDDPIVESAINYTTGKDVVIVAAAGNGNTGEPSYPAAYPGVISVAATDQNDRRAAFSNFGSTIDLAAPGVGIVSTASPTSYGQASGTSFSSPYVAGVAGLLVAQGRSADQVRRRIESTAADLGPDGKDPFYGNGRIDAAAAVGVVSKPPAKNLPPKITHVRPAPGSKIKVRRPTIGATVKDRETDLNKSDITLSVDGRERSTFVYDAGTGKLSYRPPGKLSRGKHSVKITARDGQGQTAAGKWSFRMKSGGGGSGGGGPFPSIDSPGFPLDILPDKYPFTLVR